MVVDRSRNFIGSMHLDPRSAVFNAEMGVVIDSPARADALASQVARDMAPANSSQAVAMSDGGLRGHSSTGMLTREPARSTWQRVENLLSKLMPASCC